MFESGFKLSFHLIVQTFNADSINLSLNTNITKKITDGLNLTHI